MRRYKRPNPIVAHATLIPATAPVESAFCFEVGEEGLARGVDEEGGGSVKGDRDRGIDEVELEEVKADGVVDESEVAGLQVRRSSR